jgi:hypothetical protein
MFGTNKETEIKGGFAGAQDDDDTAFLADLRTKIETHSMVVAATQGTYKLNKQVPFTS